MARPKGNQLSKAEFVELLDMINQAVSDDVIDVSSNVTAFITAVTAEIAAR